MRAGARLNNRDKLEASWSWSRGNDRWVCIPQSQHWWAGPNPATSHQKAKMCGRDNAEGGLWALCSTQSGLQGQLHLRIRHYDKAEVHLIPDIPSALQHGTVGQETALRWPQVAHSQLPRVGLFFWSFVNLRNFIKTNCKITGEHVQSGCFF